jgi:hypothetical protein
MALGVVSRGKADMPDFGHCNGPMIEHGFAIRT